MGVVNSYQELKRMDHESIYRSSPNEAFSRRLFDLFPRPVSKLDEGWDVTTVHRRKQIVFPSEQSMMIAKSKQQTAAFDRDLMES